MSSRAEAEQSQKPWPQRPLRLAAPVTEAVVELVVSGQFPAGSTLPTEPEMCHQFAVSRPVVREAVKAVEHMRLVHVRQGQGTTVQPLEDWDLLDPIVLAATVRHDAELAILDDLIDVRIALESQMAGQAASRIDDTLLAELKATLARLHKLTEDHDGFTAADSAFHDLIMVSSGNRLGRAIIRTVAAEALQSTRYIGEPTNADRLHSNQGHEAILKALNERTPPAASRAMATHISESWARRRPTNRVAGTTPRTRRVRRTP
jgi:GntR family transcriptional regulator, galactonate operon transcriptional repressor